MLFINFVLIQYAQVSLIDADALSCNPNSGPSGITECVELLYYNDYQWATCLTDAYIKQKSNGKYLCDNSGTYCWFQCMMETYSSLGPNIIGKCSCKPGDSPTNLAPPFCQSPSGSDCNWYKDCLEATYPCSGTDASYAVDFGEKFCRLYNDNYDWLSSTGRRWVDAARRCLQVSSKVYYHIDYSVINILIKLP